MTDYIRVPKFLPSSSEQSFRQEFLTWVGGLSVASWPVGIMVVGSMPGSDAGSYLIKLLWVPISDQVRAVELNST